LRLGDGGENQLGKKIGIAALERLRIDDDLAHDSSPICLYPNETTARSRFDETVGQFGLQLLQSTLDLLTQLEQLIEIGHGLPGNREREREQGGNR